ncbi:hydrocephalus-inducing protein homolog [Melanerpes formicivorus]|uniref:hydrocephalus-inducing protein homolog n=1 Tax=Melanerpes formicivorus TaxID=211600 RepID=UPI00358FA39A
MATEQNQRSRRPSKMPEGLQGTVAAPGHLKPAREAKQPATLPAALQQSCFEPLPAEVLFQNCLPHQVYEETLVLRNKGRVPQWVKVIMETSPYFKLLGPMGVRQKVAPGMASTYRILFTPEEHKDYCHQLLCVTQREEFPVPIRAVGAQAVLDFPQQLHFSLCPVRHSTQRTLLLRNLGQREAHYSLSTQSPFSAEPCVGALGVGDAVQVAVEFLPLRSGEHRGVLSLHCDSGEDIHSSLSGTAVDVNIRLDRSSLAMQKTYLSLSTRSTLLIHNGSDVRAHFQWKAAASQEEEEQQQQRLQGQFKPHPPEEPRKQPALQGRRSRLSHICQQQRAKAQAEALLRSQIFSIEPLVTLHNKGAIDASFSLVPPSTALGSCFSFSPCQGLVLPGGSQVVQVCFCPSSLGHFREEFSFCVEGSPEPVTLSVRGCVSAPSLHFDVPCLRFGDVSYGFPHSLSCRLTNASPLPLAFALRLPGDGTAEPSVPSAAQLLDNSLPSWRRAATGLLRPCEFTISPCRGTICAKSFVDIQVTLCSNTLGTYKLALVVDVDGVGQELLSLPLTARCVVPALRVPKPVVTFGRCYLQLPAQQLLTLVNDSDLPGCYALLPQEQQEEAAVLYSSPVPCGIIQPHSSVEMPLTLVAQALGSQDTPASVAVFGCAGHPLEIHLVSIGQGPVVSVQPQEINFGSIPVLQDVSRSLQLCNQSPIPAAFQAEVAGRGCCWRVEPSRGVIPAEGQVSVSVTAHLDDTGQFQAEVQLLVEHSRGYGIPVRALGVGSTIVLDRPLAPQLSLGTRFSLAPCCYSFQVTNRGRRSQRLYWTLGGCSLPAQRGQLPALSSTEARAPPQSLAAACPVFQLRPKVMELRPGQTMEVMLEAFSSTPQAVREQLLCQAAVGGEARRRQILQVELSCQFVAPALQMSSTAISFHVEKQAGDVLTPLAQPLSLKNICPLPLSMVLALGQPFSICDVEQQPLPADAQPMKLEAGQELQLCISFNPAHEEGLHSWQVEQALRIQFLEHPHQEQVLLRGEVCCPNLHFQSMAVDFGCILNGTGALLSDATQQEGALEGAVGAPSPAGMRQLMKLKETEPHRLGLEEVFDVLPLYGLLQPGQSQQVTFSFFGHPNVVACARALCRVQGGPSYELRLRGEASLLSYHLDTTELDFGLQLWDSLLEAEVTLQNSGKLPFTFVVLSPGTATARSPLPGVPLVVPSTGCLEAGQQQVLKVSYLPEVPGLFCKAFQLQVGHLQPEEICLRGEGSFPRICLHLPRNIQGNKRWEQILRELRGELAQDKERERADVLGEAAATEPPPDDSDATLDTGLQVQLEDILLKEHILEQQAAVACSAPKEAALRLPARRRLLEAELPEYILDFGCVGLGGIHRRSVKVTSLGHFPVSFQVPGQLLCGTGFSVELESVEQLPCSQSRSFTVCLEPQSATLPLGQAALLLPIQVTGGPTVRLLLRARGVVPSLCLSRARLDFSPLQCGQCQEETTRLYNQLPVPCQWFLSREEPAQKVDKPLAASRRGKLLQEPKAKAGVFEVLPSAGVLAPGQWCNLRVRFCPVEEKLYRSNLKIHICHSSQHLQLLVSGSGLEPRLEFQPEVLELGPVLPSSPGAQGTVVVKNPCSFPIEFYSLEYDLQYLAEEQILRALEGFDCRSTLLLPPRKTSAAAALAKHYGAACLSLDAVVSEAVAAGSSAAGRRARELCSAGSQQSPQQPQDGRSPGWRRYSKARLSRSLSQPSSGDRGSQHSLSSPGQARAGAGKRKMSVERQLAAESSGSQGSSGSPLVSAPPAQLRLSPRGSGVAELGLGSCVLPQELLVAILSERLQLRDCCQGVVFDGLQSLCAGSTLSALLCLLQAVGNRPHIYFVNLLQDYGSWQARQAAAEERAGREQEAAARREEALLWELGEEEFAALPQQQQAQLESRIRQLQRQRKQRLQLAREQQEQQQRCKEAEELEQQGKGRGKRSLVRQSTKTSSGSSKEAPGRQQSIPKRRTEKGSAQECSASAAPGREEEEQQSKLGLADSCSGEQSEQSLALRFQSYEASRQHVAHLLSCWDRVQGVPAEPGVLQPAGQQQPSPRLRRQKSRKELQKRLGERKLAQLEGEGAAGAGGGQAVGVPCLDIEVLSCADVLSTILESRRLPRPEQVLDELGLGPSGPPLPPTAFYSVAHYPAKRELPVAEAEQHFVLLPQGAPGPEEEAASVRTVKFSEEQGAPGRGHWRGARASSSQEAVRRKRSSGDGRRALRRSATVASIHPSEEGRRPTGTVPAPESCARSSSYRWVVPAQGQVVLQVHFSSALLGSFEQRLHFELLGTKRPYQLHCRGSCLYPTISQEPREVFPRCRQSKAAEAILCKEYVLGTRVFHFGPLLCGKARERSKAVLQAGNREQLSIRNVSPWEAEVHFSWERGGSRGTFLLEPASMKLQPYEKQELSVWAYPTAVGLVEDSLICRIKDNPEPVVFQLCCQGVQVKLEVSPRQLHFARVLLHREQSRMLLLRNNCPLPVAWRLSGLESLGQSFWVSQSQGTVGPRSELAVQLCFRASKPLSVEKKIRLEVSDAENVQGVVQVENIQVLAEAYEVALNITLPEGAEGCLDFGVLNVLGSAKQVLTLRNQGQCKLAYRFRLRPAGPSTQDLASHFTVQPQQGLLPLSERPVAVQLLFHPQRELSIEDKAVLLCQVLEPSLRAGGEPMASIPVRLSARAVLSQYSISPAALLDCGAMASGTRRACSFLLHNTGLLPFQFLICRAEQGAAEPTEQGKSSQAQRRQSLEGTSAAARLSCRQAGLTLGMFTVSPAFGCILAGEQQLVRVDCAAGPPGPCQEQLLIDISHRDPRDNPLGIPYTLLAESCLPAFVVDDIEAIFEGHQICSSSNLCPGLQRGQEQQGVFLTDQRKFLFPDVLVGQRATARFSICNRNRVPCDVLLSIKASPRKLKSRPGQVFQVDPAQLCVPSCSQAFATVTFSPQKVQRYQCTFEACLDAQRSPAAGRAQSLSFEISGEGKVPEVRVLRPARRDRRGNPLLLFRKLPLGAWEKLPLVLQNSGPVPAQVLLDLLDEEGAFFLKARPSTKCLYQAVGMEDSAGEERKLHTASLLLQCGQAAELEVLFRASLPQRLEGKLQLAVLDNPAGASTIRLLGAGCQEDFSLDNIQGLVADREEENLPESSLEEDSLEAAPGHHIQFGACALGTPCSVTFSLTNRSREQALRFQWLPEAPFHFCPQVGHLHAGCAKDVTVTLQSAVEVTFQRHPVRCLLSRICFQLPPEEVPDWDDRLGTLKWVDTTRAPGASWPLKKKVLEPEAEPAHTVLEGSSREVQLLLSAVVTGAELQLPPEELGKPSSASNPFRT